MSLYWFLIFLPCIGYTRVIFLRFFLHSVWWDRQLQLSWPVLSIYFKTNWSTVSQFLCHTWTLWSSDVCVQSVMNPTQFTLLDKCNIGNSRWCIKTDRNPHKIISCRIIFLMKLFTHPLSEPLGLRFPFKRHDFIWFHLFNNYFNSVWFLVLRRKKTV